MFSAMRPQSVLRPPTGMPQRPGMNSQKMKYAQLYERALQDKIQTQLAQTHLQSSSPSTFGQSKQLTPSSYQLNGAISTLELIEFVLREHEQSHPVMMDEAAPVAKKACYSLYEDLKIIYSLGKDSEQITSASYKRLAEEGYIRRTLESVKSRYTDFLTHLTKEDYQNILSYAELNGLKGYLIFEKDEATGKRVLQKISKHDSRELPSANVAGSTPSKSGFEDHFGFTNASPSRGVNGQFPFFLPQYPQMHASPYKNPQQMFYDQQMFNQQMMMMMMQMQNPYYPQTQPYMHPMMAAAAQRRSFGQHTEETGDFEVRPSQKRSASKAQLDTVNGEDVEGTKKKLKTGLQVAPPPAQANGDGKEKVQSTLTFNKAGAAQQQTQTSGLLLNKSKHNQGGQMIQQQQQHHHQHQQQQQQPGASLLAASSQPSRPLTKEVYELISEDDRIPVDQLEPLLEYVAGQLKRSKLDLINILDALNGSFKDLQLYLKTNQSTMLWTPEEDEILASIRSQDSSEFKLLVKLKGIESIKKRIIYNDIQLPMRIL